MRTPRQQFIDRALIRILRDCTGYLVKREVLMDTLAINCQPVPRADEFDDAINHAVASRRIISANTETGVKYKITDDGLTWARETNV